MVEKRQPVYHAQCAPEYSVLGLKDRSLTQSREVAGITYCPIAKSGTDAMMSTNQQPITPMMITGEL
eukprot:1058859-Rhodomonas_salina.1